MVGRSNHSSKRKSIKLRRRHPFFNRILDAPLPLGWKPLNIDRYDGTKNNDEHLEAYIAQESEVAAEANSEVDTLEVGATIINILREKASKDNKKIPLVLFEVFSTTTKAHPSNFKYVEEEEILYKGNPFLLHFKLMEGFVVVCYDGDMVLASKECRPIEPYVAQPRPMTPNVDLTHPMLDCISHIVDMGMVPKESLLYTRTTSKPSWGDMATCLSQL
ncbi:hypothetical protein JHK82_050170 [Glycine max]|nr:hypothetical protein JHK82_050170 [Glycine max]